MPVLDIREWQQRFQALIRQEELVGKWSLELDDKIFPNKVASKWTQFQLNAFAEFHCSSCYRSWTSAQVKILFHMCWEPWTSQGQVLMRIFAQRCQKCSSSKFEAPKFSKESMMTILESLAQYILQRYFGRIPKKTPAIRRGHVGKPHDAANCERCTLGHCCAKRSVENKAKPSKPSGSFPESYSSPRYGNDTVRDSTSLGEVLLVLGIAILGAIFVGKAL